MAQPIQLVCLDLGGVLVRVCGGWEEACQVAKLELPAVPDFAAVAALHHASHRLEIGRMSESEFDHEVAVATGLTPAQVAAAAEAWLKGAYPGAFDCVGRLAAHPAVRSACLSNTNTRHWRMLNSPGPNDLGLDRLARRFVSHEIGIMKPLAEIYRHVGRECGCEPGTILFFDDNAGNVAGARACGWQAEVIDPAGDPPGQVIEWLGRYGVEA